MTDREDNLPKKIPSISGADIATVLAKGGVGWIPWVGPLCAEIAGTVIPGQRIDRIHKLVELIAQKVNCFDEEFARQRMTSPHSVDLLEDCFLSAASARSTERLDYLASLYVNGVTAEEADAERDRKVLKLLDAITDAEVVWLAHIANRGSSDSEEKHGEILAPVGPHLGSSPEALDKNAIRKSWGRQLEELGLVSSKLKIDHRTKEPVVDRSTKDWSRTQREATWLGRMLLNHIGIEDSFRHPRVAVGEGVQP